MTCAAQPDARPQEALQGNAQWNFESERAKLLALGVHNQDTSDLEAVIAARHARKPEIASRLRLRPEDVVLDLGSGLGYIAEVIAPEVARVHCCDISPTFLADCRDRLKLHDNVELHQIAYADLSSVYGKGINKAYSTLVFIHFNFYDILFYLQEMNKVLRKGGLFYFDYMDGERYSLENKKDSFQEHVTIYKENRESWVFGCMHMTSFSILRNIVPQLGFRIVDHWATPTSFSQMTLEKIAGAAKEDEMIGSALETLKSGVRRVLRGGRDMSIAGQIAGLEIGARSHAAGTLSNATLARLEQLLPANMTNTAETGCGKSTIMFSNVAQHHTVFCHDDRSYGENSSISYFADCTLTRMDRVEIVLGPTQKTLPLYAGFRPYDCVLIDGPHGYPFPEMEYYHFYPHLRPGALLILDDVHIPTIGRLADFIAEDAMFDLVELVSTTAVFRRTDAPTFDPSGDGWWDQAYNRRRLPPESEFHLADKAKRPPFGDNSLSGVW